MFYIIMYYIMKNFVQVITLLNAIHLPEEVDCVYYIEDNEVKVDTLSGWFEVVCYCDNDWYEYLNERLNERLRLFKDTYELN